MGILIRIVIVIVVIIIMVIRMIIKKKTNNPHTYRTLPNPSIKSPQATGDVERLREIYT